MIKSVLLRKKGVARQMGQSARQRIIEKFNLDTVIKKTLNIYQQTIKAQVTKS